MTTKHQIPNSFGTRFDIVKTADFFCSLAIVALLWVFPGLVFGNQELVRGKGCHKYGDSETPSAAKKVAANNAKRNAIESYKVFVSSKSQITNFELKNDIVTSISLANLYELNIIKEEEKDREVCISIQAKLAPDEVNRMIENKILTSKLGLDTSDETEKVEDGIVDWSKKVIRVNGFGGANKSFPSHVWKKSAEDAARADAQTKLVETIEGLRLESKKFIQNYQVAVDEKIVEVKGKLRNIRQIGRTVYPTNDTAEVVIEINVEDVFH